MSKNLVTEIRNIAVGTFILGVIQIICAFFAANRLELTGTSVICGTILGCAVAALNFSLMGIILEKSISKGKSASSMMGIGYILRLVIIAAAIIWAMKADYLNYVCAAVPFLFPRIVIFVLNFTRNRERKRKENERT